MEHQGDSPNSSEQKAPQSEATDGDKVAPPEVLAAAEAMDANVMAAMLGHSRHPYYWGFGSGGLNSGFGSGSGAIYSGVGSGTVYSVQHAQELERLNRQLQVLLAEREEVEKRLREHQPGAAEELKVKNAKLQEQLKEIENQLKQQARDNELAPLLQSLGPETHEPLRRSPDFSKLYTRMQKCTAFVMSVDIRKSTDLMLKAQRPELFAEFITQLCAGLRKAVWDQHGIFDKFTGDGILAYFPEIHAGPDAGYYAVRAAHACHKIFKELYRAHRGSFTCVSAGAGLGVGIDYGDVSVVTAGGALTIVGAPVVYACRLGCGPANKTLLNQQAYDEISKKQGPYCPCKETEQEIKEDTLVAYEVELNGEKPNLAPPSWLERAKHDSQSFDGPAPPHG